MARLPAPISDYVTDTKSVLDQSLRILQAMTDVSADAGWLDTALVTMMLVQSLMQVSPPPLPTPSPPPPNGCCHSLHLCLADLFGCATGSIVAWVSVCSSAIFYVKYCDLNVCYHLCLYLCPGFWQKVNSVMPHSVNCDPM